MCLWLVDAIVHSHSLRPQALKKQKLSQLAKLNSAIGPESHLSRINFHNTFTRITSWRSTKSSKTAYQSTEKRPPSSKWPGAVALPKGHYPASVHPLFWSILGHFIGDFPMICVLMNCVWFKFVRYCFSTVLTTAPGRNFRWASND